MKIRLNSRIGGRAGGRAGGKIPNLGPVGEALLDKIAEKNSRLTPEEIEALQKKGYAARGTGFVNKATGKFVSNKEIDSQLGDRNKAATRVDPEPTGDPVFDAIRSIQQSINAFAEVILDRDDVADAMPLESTVDKAAAEPVKEKPKADTQKPELDEIPIFKKFKALAGIAAVFLLQFAYPLYLKAKEMFQATSKWVKKMSIIFQEKVLPFFTVDIPRYVEDIKDFFTVKVPSYFSQFTDAVTTGIQNILDVPKEVLYAMEGFATSFARSVIGTVSPWVSKIGLKLDSYDEELKKREQNLKQKKQALDADQKKREESYQERKREREVDRLAFDAVKDAERQREDRLRQEEFDRRRREANMPPRAPAAPPSPAAPAPSTTPYKPSAATKEDPSMLARATRAASNFTALGITNKYAQQAILKVAAKESGIQATRGESGAAAWIATVSSNRKYTYAKGTPREKNNLTGYQYMREVFPQLKFIEGGRYLSDGELLNALKSGDEFFFDLAYGIGNPGQTLGNKLPGDGWKFRGRGYIQITGRATYTNIGKILNVPLDTDPDLITKDADVASKAAAVYLALSIGQRDYKKGVERLNSFKDAQTALQYIALNVASGGAGMNEKLLQKKLGSANFQQQLSMAEEKGGAVAVQAVSASGQGQQVSTATQNADVRPPPTNTSSTATAPSQKVASNEKGGRTSPPNSDSISRGYKDHFAVS